MMVLPMELPPPPPPPPPPRQQHRKTRQTMQPILNVCSTYLNDDDVVDGVTAKDDEEHQVLT